MNITYNVERVELIKSSFTWKQFLWPLMKTWTILSSKKTKLDPILHLNYPSVEGPQSIQILNTAHPRQVANQQVYQNFPFFSYPQMSYLHSEARFDRIHCFPKIHSCYSHLRPHFGNLHHHPHMHHSWHFHYFENWGMMCFQEILSMNCYYQSTSWLQLDFVLQFSWLQFHPKCLLELQFESNDKSKVSYYKSKSPTPDTNIKCFKVILYVWVQKYTFSLYKAAAVELYFC